MPLSVEDHIDNLVRHIRLVQDACLLMGTKLIRNGQLKFGKDLIARGFKHDNSKFFGIEWEYLHNGDDIPKERLIEAIRQHNETNEHHINFYGNLEEMPDISLAECICDIYARSQEFGTSLRDYIEEEFKIKHNLNDGDLARVNKFVDLLLEKPFQELT